MPRFSIAFDLDGTLLHSVPQIAASVNATLSEMGLPHLDNQTVQSFVGRGLPALIDQVMTRLDLPADIAGHLHDRVLLHYTTIATDPNALYPGVRPALEVLKDAGHCLSICTNKPGAATHTCLADTGLAPLFERVVCGDDLPTRKPDPAMLLTALNGAVQALYVGDSETDAETATNANVPFLLFTEGYRKTPIEDLNHTAAFSEFEQLPALVKKVCSFG